MCITPQWKLLLQGLIIRIVIGLTPLNHSKDTLFVLFSWYGISQIPEKEHHLKLGRRETSKASYNDTSLLWMAIILITTPRPMFLMPRLHRV
jgi:hypothetical protein